MANIILYHLVQFKVDWQQFSNNHFAVDVAILECLYCSKVLRKSQPVSTPGDVDKDEWEFLSNDIKVRKRFWSTKTTCYDYQTNTRQGPISAITFTAQAVRCQVSTDPAKLSVWDQPLGNLENCRLSQNLWVSGGNRSEWAEGMGVGCNLISGGSKCSGTHTREVWGYAPRKFCPKQSDFLHARPYGAQDWGLSPAS